MEYEINLKNMKNPLFYFIVNSILASLNTIKSIDWKVRK